MARNKTADDARYLVTQARVGSLAGAPTEEYLVALRRELGDWLEQVNVEMRSLATLRASAAEMAAEQAPDKRHVFAAVLRLLRDPALRQEVSEIEPRLYQAQRTQRCDSEAWWAYDDAIEILRSCEMQVRMGWSPRYDVSAAEARLQEDASHG